MSCEVNEIQDTAVSYSFILSSLALVDSGIKCYTQLTILFGLACLQGEA